MRTTTILLAALVLACGGSEAASNEDTSTGNTTSGDVDGSSSGGTTTTTSGPDCTPGTEGCACDEGTCEGELSCFSQICVMLPAESSSSGGVETSTSNAESTESSSDDSSSSSDESSSSTGPAIVPCEEEGNHVCHDGILDVCTLDVVVSQSCDDLCAETGYLSPGCADINGCACDGYADATCETIMTNFCNCYGLMGFPCSEAFEMNVYNWCFDPTVDAYSHDVVVCFGAYADLTLDECNVLYEMCF
jgi:hypothetical protein